MKKFLKSAAPIKAFVEIIHRLDPKMFPTVILMAAISGVTPVLSALILSYALDGMAAELAPIQVIGFALIGFSVVFALSVVGHWLYKWCTVRAWGVFMRFNMQKSDKSMDMDYPQLEAPETHKLRDRMTADTNWGSGIWSVLHASNLFLQFAVGLIASIILLIARFWGTRFFSSGISLVYMAALIGATALISSVSVRLSKKIVDVIQGMSTAPRFRFVRYTMWESGITYRQGKDVRVYGAEPMIAKRLDLRKNSAVYRSSKLGGLNGGAKSGFNALVIGGSYLFVAVLAHGGALTVGAVYLLATTLSQFSSSFMRVVQGWRELGISTDRLKSTREYLELLSVFYRGTLPIEKRRDYEYELEFRDVSFKYPGSDAYALRNINLKLNVGQRLAVVGMNGSGKTTLIKLLCRLYDPTEGAITLNGIDIRKYDYDEYLRIFGVVFQDFKLFALPIGQNVAASTDVDAARAAECLEKAGLGERLHAMPDGLNTCLYKDYAEDGVEISGGEAQKIALARALYKDAPFIILDEPTAALDPIAEFEVYSKMNQIVGERSAVFISHRLSSCRFCHDIAVFHEGELVQRGSHEALLSEVDGQYAALWHAQAQYYVEGTGEEVESVAHNHPT